jgi:hypothetical protein
MFPYWGSNFKYLFAYFERTEHAEVYDRSSREVSPGDCFETVVGAEGQAEEFKQPCKWWFEAPQSLEP